MVIRLVRFITVNPNGKLSQFKVVVRSSEKDSIYEAVRQAEERILSADLISSGKIPRYPIDKILSLHNAEAIDTGRVREMARKTKHGEPILQKNGLPNIKLVRLHGGCLLAFDGHHSLLAYRAAGKTDVGQVPHLLVTSPNGIVRFKDIQDFFGQYRAKVTKENWQSWSLNWFRKPPAQLERKKERTIGDLYRVLKSSLSG